jgi:holliday junction DNA helicase RuvA
VISAVTGRLVLKELDRVEIMTSGGVGYELQIPLAVYEALPKLGDTASLHTHLVVKEDGWQLFGFATAFERRVFQRVLNAKGVGPALALGMLSTLSAERLVRAIRERDIATLQSVPRVGRKKAEQLILDLADKLDDVQQDTATPGAPRPEGAGTEDAIRALVSLGYTLADAEKAVRAAIDANGRGMSAPELIRASLAKIGGR